MKMDRFDKFVAVAVGGHALLGLFGYIFVGLEYTILLFIFWGLTWITYCGAAAERWDEAVGPYDEKVSIAAQALVGGPLCWLLSPTCLIPSVQRRAAGFAMLWHLFQRLSQVVRKSVLKTMDLLHGFCEKEFPASQSAANETEE